MPIELQNGYGKTTQEKKRTAKNTALYFNFKILPVLQFKTHCCVSHFQYRFLQGSWIDYVIPMLCSRTNPLHSTTWRGPRKWSSHNVARHWNHLLRDLWDIPSSHTQSNVTLSFVCRLGSPDSGACSLSWLSVNDTTPARPGEFTQGTLSGAMPQGYKLPTYNVIL